MIFRGADDMPYEVRGVGGKFYNVISSPRLSVNAQFLKVPPAFPTLAVGDLPTLAQGAMLGGPLCGHFSF